MTTSKVPIHSLRLCYEGREFLKRDAILVMDGDEMVNCGRQSIPTYYPGHRLNSGVTGCMGIGVGKNPFWTRRLKAMSYQDAGEA